MNEKLINNYNKFKPDKLEPLPHQTLDNHYRVPVWYEDPNYIVFIGYKHTRTFTENTIPPCILSKLTMARASGITFTGDDHIDYLGVYYYHGNDSMGDIAWQVSKSLYIVVLEERELRSLFGEENDTRSESKSESKESLR